MAHRLDCSHVLSGLDSMGVAMCRCLLPVSLYFRQRVLFRLHWLWGTCKPGGLELILTRRLISSFSMTHYLKFSVRSSLWQALHENRSVCIALSALLSIYTLRRAVSFNPPFLSNFDIRFITTRGSQLTDNGCYPFRALEYSCGPHIECPRSK